MHSHGPRHQDATWFVSLHNDLNFFGDLQRTAAGLLRHLIEPARILVNSRLLQLTRCKPHQQNQGDNCMQDEKKNILMHVDLSPKHKDTLRSMERKARRTTASRLVLAGDKPAL